MSLAIAFPSQQQVPRFLRWVAQPQVGYAWGDDDRFVVVTVLTDVRQGRRTVQKREHKLWLWLPDADARDPGLKHAVDLSGCKASPDLPDAADGGRRLTLDEFLRSATPVRPRAASRKARHDLLAAFYDVPPLALAEAFSAVPKNPAHPSTLEVLEETDTPDTPRGLLRLPQADPGYPWHVWVEAENRRLAAGGPAALKLFTLLPGGATCDYYVEYGYVHPFPELGTLYRPPPNTRLVLIAATTRAGAARTCWTHLAPRMGDALFDADAAPEVPFEFVLSDRSAADVATVGRAGDKLLVRPRVETISAGERADLAGIERAIQGSKNALARLEQSRAHLLDRRDGRFRFLLAFDQPPAAADAVPELAPAFQRFLLLSRRQADQLQYVFQDRAAGGGRHLIFTRDPVFYRDLHTGLADAAYFQPAAWQDWGFEVFVRDGCELLPRIDAPDLARPLFAALAGAAGEARPGEGRLLLVDPDGTPAGHLRITAVPVPPETDLPGRLGFVNTDYPVASVRSRAVARDEMKKEMDAQELNLEQEVRRTEELVAAEALARLDETRAAWDQTAGALDRTRGGVEQIEEQRRACDQLLDRFAGTWQQLVTGVLRFNEALVAPLLDALAALDRARAGWADAIDRAAQAHVDVGALLPPIRDEVEDRVRQGRETHERMERLYEVMERHTAAGERDLTDWTAKVNGWRTRADQAAATIERQHATLTGRVDAIARLLAELDQTIARLEAGRAEFFRLVTATTDADTRAAGLVQQMADFEKAIREAVAGWALAATTVERRQVEVERAVARGEREVAALRARVEAAHAVVDATDARLKQAADELDRRRTELETRVVTTRAEAARVADARVALGPLVAAVAAAVGDRTREAEALTAVAATLGPAVKRIDDTRLAALADLAGACMALAADLTELAALEVEAVPLRKAQKAARARAAVAAAVPGFDPLRPEVHAALYGPP